MLAPRPVKAYSIGSGRVLVYPSDDRSTLVISSQLYAVYQRLSGFNTSTDHIRALQSGSPDAAFADQPAALLESGIDELSHLGLLVSREEVLEKTTSRELSEGGESGNAGIDTITWPTCGRPLALIRSVASAVRNVKRFGHSPAIQVYDDTHTPDKRLIKNLGSLAAREGVQVCYCGREEKEAYIHTLSEHAGLTGEQKHLLSFALFGKYSIDTHMDNTYGGNCNTILLGTAGQKALCSDDDAVFTGIDMSGDEGWGALRIHPHERLLNVRHFESSKATFGAYRYDDIDILAAHESYLGNPLSSIIARNENERIELSGLHGAMLGHIMDTPSEPVRLTLPGLIGDSGRPNNHMLLSESGTDRWLEEEHLDTALHSRYVHRFTDTPTVSSQSHFMSTFFAMDNREILPPFFPLGRGNDGAFGAAFRYVYRRGLIAYLPVGMMHAPMPHRESYSEGIEDIHTRVSDVLTRLTDRLTRISDVMLGPPREQCTRLGEYFLQLSRLPVKDFTELLREVNAEFLSHYIAFLEEKLETADAPPEQVVEIYHTHIGAVQQYMTSKLFAKPSNIATPDEKKYVVLQRLLNYYGRLLIHWPTLHSAAKSAASEGIRPWSLL